MTEQNKDVVEAAAQSDAPQVSSPDHKDDFKLGIDVIDKGVTKIDSGIRRISTQVHKIVEQVSKKS